MKTMTSNEIHQAIRKALDQVSLRLATGKLDHSGRYYSEPELRLSSVNFPLHRKDSVRARATVPRRRKTKSA